MSRLNSSNYHFPISLFFTVVMVVSLSFDACALGIHFSTEELMEKAELVVIGKVIDKTGINMVLNASIPDGSSDQETYLSIMTKYEIEIVTIRKGAYENETIGIFSYGGQVGDEIDRWSIGYDFTVGDDVLLLLTKSKADSVWMTVHQADGAFLLVNRDEYWRVSSMNTDHMVVRGGGDPGKFQQNTIETLEIYVNGGKKQ